MLVAGVSISFCSYRTRDASARLIFCWLVTVLYVFKIAWLRIEQSGRASPTQKKCSLICFIH